MTARGKRNAKLRVLVVGVGTMGASHGRAYDSIDGFELAGLCARHIAKRTDLPQRWSNVPRFADYGEALETLKPDVVSINTWPDTHADYAVAAFKAGAHVFMEKPIAETVKDAKRVVTAARAAKKKLVIGYILRVHPSWIKFVDLAKRLGKPLVMRMNLNQQSIGDAWTWHKNLMKSLPPIASAPIFPKRRRPTITATCTSSSTMDRSDGTRPDGAR
jgi:predicted dehydrogenase